ncbi:MAG TPA: hypothetical protein VHA53_07910 [Nitrolancea sp.]|nr:hypothetical protein [Nitrolancea sp.]
MSQRENALRGELNEVAQALEAVRAAVRRNAGFASESDVPAAQRSHALTELADLAVISAHLPVTWSTPFVGRALAYSKRGMRILLRWYINPIVDQQNTFNEALVRVIASLEERLQEIERTLAQHTTDNDA